MAFSSNIKYKDLKLHIAYSIKESCYKPDARIYNIANEVNHIETYTLEAGVEFPEGLSKIIEKTIKSSVEVDCDMAVVVKGLMIGAFRASPAGAQESKVLIETLIKELLTCVCKFKGDARKTVEGILAAMIIVAHEFKLNTQETMLLTREQLLTSSQRLDPDFCEQVKSVLPNIEGIL